MSARRISATLFVLFVAAGLASLPFPPRARVYPLWVAVMGTAMVVAAWLRTSRNEVPTGPAFATVAPYLAWVVGYLALAALSGLPAASAVFVAFFLNRLGDVGRARSAVAGIATAGVLILLGSVLGLRWPWALFDLARAVGLT